MPAELDYAFIADFARVEANGTLTAVNASWMFLETPAIPTTHRMAVAGRIRAGVQDGPIDLRIEIETPNEQLRFAANSTLAADPNQRPYGGGLVGHLFALDIEVPLVVEGMYWVNISIDGTRARRLGFELVLRPPAGS